MKKKQKLAKALLSTMIVTSMAATPAFADLNATTAGAVKLSFPDVKSDYWGIKHISKLALEGIIEGYEDGSYRSENSVSQQEVLVMAIRMMGLDADAKAMTATTVFPDFLMVDDYFRNYVALAREKGLITYEEEKARSELETSKTKWGQRPATREWVAQIVIRAIGKQTMAASMGSQPTDFTDNNSISYAALGYVNSAVALSIVNGFEDGSFKPKGFVTRAQMAAFLSRSQKELAQLPARAVRGYVTGMTTGSISLMDKDGNTSTYSLSSDAAFFGNKNDERIAASTIQETYEVTVVQVNGTAYYVEVLNDELQMDIYEGSLLKLSLSELKVDVYRNDAYEKYELSPDVTVTDKDGRGLSLGSLVSNSVIELRRSKLSKSTKITSIVVKQVPLNKSSEGVIQSMNKSANQITILETSSNQSESFTLSSKVITAFADNSLGDVNSLHVGDTIAYDVANSEVAKIVIKKQADIGITVEGTLTSLNPEKTIITINKTAGSKLGSYYLANNVQVQIEGMTSAGVYDLEIGDTLKLDVLNDQVTNIVVTSRTIQNIYLSKMISYDAGTKFLLVQDDKGNPKAYQLTDATTIMYAGAKLPYANFTGIFTSGKRVDLKVSNDKLLQIQMSEKLEGTIAQLNLQSNDITVKAPSGQNLTFKVTYGPAVEIPNKPNSALTDLKIGDPVAITLSYDQTYVTKITVNKTLMFKTLLLNNGNKQATVMDEAGASFVFNLDGVTLFKPNQTAALFTDIERDEYLKVSFKGYSISKAELVLPVRGKITAVDAASSTMTVQDFAGNSQVIGLGSNYAITMNGGSSLSFNSLKIGDRVQIMKDPNEKMLVQVAAIANRVVSSYDNVLNQMVFKAASAGDKLSYNLHPKAYYHNGTQLLTPASFAANEQVTFYVLEDKIVEMEKK